MRTAFIEQLTIEARSNEKIFLVVGDLGYSVVEAFANEFPDRYLNAGVSEQNMTGIAAGLALEGYQVFTYSIGNFPTLRSLEQIRNEVCYHNLNVKIIAVGGGFAYGSMGPSHHATEELGILRTLPNLQIAAPGDPHEARAITSLFCATSGPAYMRLGKAGEPNVHAGKIDLHIGDMICVKAGTKVAVITTGAMLYGAYQHILTHHQDWALYSCPFLGMVNTDTLMHLANNFESVITIEEHQRNAGFGSFVLEQFSDLVEQGMLTAMPSVKRIAIPNTFVSVAGTQEYLRQKMGLYSW